MRTPEDLYRDICLVLTGYYPENNLTTNDLNIKTGKDIFNNAIRLVRQESEAQTQLLNNQIYALTKIHLENKGALDARISALEAALLPLSGTRDFIEQHLDEICEGVRKALAPKDGAV